MGMQAKSQMMHAEGLLTIGAMAECSGVTVRALRYYEELNLIEPEGRTQGRYRLYHPRTLQRIKAILALQDLHFSLDEIAQILGPSETEMSGRCQRLEETRQALERQKQALQKKMDLLTAMQHEVESRERILELVCHPCAEKHPGTDCEQRCEYRDTHFN